MNILKTAGLLAIILTASSCGSRDRYITIQGYAQGGTYSVKLNLKGEEGMIRTSPEKIRQAIDSILLDIDTTLSGYNKGSLLSRFNAGKTIPLTPLFEDMYLRAYDFYTETDGAIDVASAPLFDLWGFGFTTDSLPSDEKVKSVMASCGMKRLRRDIRQAGSVRFCAIPAVRQKTADSTTAELHEEVSVSGRSLLTDEAAAALPEEFKDTPVKLNFNAIAQGYSCDLVAAYLYGLGVKDMLVDIGEIYCDGVNPSGKPWRVGVDRPVDGNNSPGQDIDGIWESNGGPCGIVTSGNYRKFYVRGGKKYAHTIDPRTGYPVQHNLLSATIVARNATEADAYATYCMVIGLDAAKKFIGDHPDNLAGYLIYTDETGEMHEWASLCFNLLPESDDFT